MSRRILVLATACVLGAGVGAAGAVPPQPPPGGGGPEPVNPPALGICSALPHPTPACSAVTVACLSTCTTTGSAGSANADTRWLGLQLPRRYSRAVLSCRAAGAVRVACKIAKTTLVTATGVHAAVFRLPKSFHIVRITCTSRTKLACAVKRLS